VVHPAVTGEEFQEAFVNRSWHGNVHRAFRTFARRVHDLHQLGDFDFIFVQKPILPAPLFNMELKISREAKMIFDFDDAVFVKKQGGAFPANLWPQTNRIAATCRRAHRVVTGNEYLADFVRKQKVEPVVIPTAVDVESFASGARVTKHAHKIPVIGWAGSATTQFDLSLAIPGLIDLHSKTPFVFRIIGGVASAMPVRFPIEWKNWNLKTEISDIAHLDYGLAPMSDTVWNRGKCGLKVLQYWAAGVPTVASPVGIYKEMIQDGVNGLLASSRAEWTEKILTLIKNPDLRHRVIAGGKKTVQEKYNMHLLTPKFLSLFEDPKKSQEKSNSSEKKTDLVPA
jgi:glycosyltransferase involved in cell wall biosynthesis